MKRDVFWIGLNALHNASEASISQNDLVNILKTGDGVPHLVRALFEDCSFESLDRMGAAAGLTSKQIVSAYLTAKVLHKVKNSDFETTE